MLGLTERRDPQCAMVRLGFIATPRKVRHSSGYLRLIYERTDRGAQLMARINHLPKLVVTHSRRFWPTAHQMRLMRAVGGAGRTRCLTELLGEVGLPRRLARDVLINAERKGHVRIWLPPKAPLGGNGRRDLSAARVTLTSQGVRVLEIADFLSSTKPVKCVRAAKPPSPFEAEVLAVIRQHKMPVSSAILRKKLAHIKPETTIGLVHKLRKVGLIAPIDRRMGAGFYVAASDDALRGQ